jgi:ribosomal protein L9
MARELTPERLKQIEIDKKRAQDQARTRLLDAYKIQEAIDGQKLEFTLKGKN